MIDVDGMEGEAEGGGQGAQDVEEGNRVGASRHRRQDDFAATEHPMAANGGENARRRG